MIQNLKERCNAMLKPLRKSARVAWEKQDRGMQQENQESECHIRQFTSSVQRR